MRVKATKADLMDSFPEGSGNAVRKRLIQQVLSDAGVLGGGVNVNVENKEVKQQSNGPRLDPNEQHGPGPTRRGLHHDEHTSRGQRRSIEQEYQAHAVQQEVV